MCIDAYKSMNIKEKMINTAMFATLFMAMGLLSLIIYWKLYPYNPMVINKRPLPISNKVVRNGDTLLYALDYCKNADLPVLIRRRFVNGIVYSVPDVSANTAKGCRNLNIGIEIPNKLPAGKYVLAVSYIYEMNPIRTIEVTTHTEKFEVAE